METLATTEHKVDDPSNMKDSVELNWIGNDWVGWIYLLSNVLNFILFLAVVFVINLYNNLALN